jgi:hypothetical protein
MDMLLTAIALALLCLAAWLLYKRYTARYKSEPVEVEYEEEEAPEVQEVEADPTPEPTPATPEPKKEA